MDYEQSRAYVESAQQYAQGALDLTNIRELMKYLGNPQDQLKFIQVAGTNGKGSVIAYIYTTLSGAGYRVGRYISPSVYTYLEKMEVAGKVIEEKKFARYVTRVAAAITEMTKDGHAHPTPFEIETAVAFLFFLEEKCELVILETGMGGDKDATNIVKNTILSLIVPISMDHQEFLGNTLAEIAEKKSGIIKKNSSVATVGQKSEALNIIKKECEKKESELVVANSDEALIVDENFDGQTFIYHGQQYELSLSGSYQTENAILAIEALNILDKRGFCTSCDQRYNGLKATRWNGRLSVIHKEPLFIVDGAHNPAAADMLEDSIKKYFSGRNLYFIVGVFADKDYKYIINKLCPYGKYIITIETPNNPRALAATELAEAIHEINPCVEAADNINDAVKKIFDLAGENDVIMSFGSLSFIGEITEIVNSLEE